MTLKKLIGKKRQKTSDENPCTDLAIEVLVLRAAIRHHKQDCLAAGGGFVRDERLWGVLDQPSD